MSTFFPSWLSDDSLITLRKRESWLYFHKSYTFTNFSGLWVGMSLLTVIEFVGLAQNLLQWLTCPQSQNVSKNEKPVLSNKNSSDFKHARNRYYTPNYSVLSRESQSISPTSLYGQSFKSKYWRMWIVQINVTLITEFNFILIWFEWNINLWLTNSMRLRSQRLRNLMLFVSHKFIFHD